MCSQAPNKWGLYMAHSVVPHRRGGFAPLCFLTHAPRPYHIQTSPCLFYDPGKGNFGTLCPKKATRRVFVAHVQNVAFENG